MLRTRRNLDRGNVEQPLHDLGVLLRLARASASRGIHLPARRLRLTSFGYDQVIRPLLASPRFLERHARELSRYIKHEGESINGYGEALKYEYLALLL